MNLQGRPNHRLVDPGRFQSRSDLELFILIDQFYSGAYRCMDRKIIVTKTSLSTLDIYYYINIIIVEHAALIAGLGVSCKSSAKQL